MSTLIVNYVSDVFLPCACSITSFGPDVVACVNPSRLAPIPVPIISPPGVPYYLGSTYRTFTARITAVYPIPNGCNPPRQFCYTLSYDSAVLGEGQVILPEDITGIFCKDCLTTWVEDLVGSLEQKIEDDMGTSVYILGNTTGFSNFTGSPPLTGVLIPNTQVLGAINYTNPTTRSLLMTVYAEAQIGADVSVAGSINGAVTQVRINGGTWTNINLLTRQSNAPWTDLLSVDPPGEITVTVAPGASIVVDVQGISLSTNAGNQIVYANQNCWVFGNSI